MDLNYVLSNTKDNWAATLMRTRKLESSGNYHEIRSRLNYEYILKISKTKRKSNIGLVIMQTKDATHFSLLIIYPISKMTNKHSTVNTKKIRFFFAILMKLKHFVFGC